jgi:hypothetical protein
MAVLLSLARRTYFLIGGTQAEGRLWRRALRSRLGREADKVARKAWSIRATVKLKVPEKVPHQLLDKQYKT